MRFKESGMIQSVLIGDRSKYSIDELITNKEEFNKQGVMLNKEGNKFNGCDKQIYHKRSG